MKSRIFMYLFIFALLAIIFQYFNDKSILDKYEADIKKYKSKIKDINKERDELKDEIFTLSIFNFEGNQEAIDYFEDQNINTEELLPKVKDGLLEMNVYQGDDHPIVPFVSMTESKIVIDQIKVLNHKWIIANFTDGKHWGELFIAYEVNNSGKVNYELKEYFLYPIH